MGQYSSRVTDTDTQNAGHRFRDLPHRPHASPPRPRRKIRSHRETEGNRDLYRETSNSGGKQRRKGSHRRDLFPATIEIRDVEEGANGHNRRRTLSPTSTQQRGRESRQRQGEQTIERHNETSQILGPRNEMRNLPSSPPPPYERVVGRHQHPSSRRSHPEDVSQPAIPTSPHKELRHTHKRHPQLRRQQTTVPPVSTSPRNIKDKSTSSSAKPKSKSKSKPKVSVTEVKFCMICTESRPLKRFPSRASTPLCTHDFNVCKHCLRTWIKTQLDSKVWNQMTCPECPNVLSHNDVKQFASKDVFHRYDRLSIRSAMEEIPGFTWCIAKGCESGQIHDDQRSTPMFRCSGCGFKHCVVHGVKWHKGETCAEFDYRTDSRIRKMENDASKMLIKEIAKKCPNPKCKWSIQKNNGCDHMTCSKCRHQFCWSCLAPYIPIRDEGPHNHRPECEHAPRAQGPPLAVGPWVEF